MLNDAKQDMRAKSNSSSEFLLDEKVTEVITVECILSQEHTSEEGLQIRPTEDVRKGCKDQIRGWRKRGNMY
ncbi:hypothetical protein SKAU_G00257340 [Synaphobranchus kaupii]|uniref:Uncharacterized protein n=1 Tax=Synaphobranchus kaupii TaxID=118154 RepID=A0A9Q1F459_SYNKA|nr:hypothetical protein SKAU_G00257340 [Synaphobranchus kaupii]